MSYAPLPQSVFDEMGELELPDRTDEAAELLARLEAEIAGRPTEALKVIATTCRKALRSSRRARAVPQASLEAALCLIAALAEGALEDR